MMTSSNDRKAKFQVVSINGVRMGGDILWTIEDLLPKTGIVVAYGASSVGKTFIMIDMMMHVALGIPYRGRRVEQGPVVYFVAESHRGFDRRCIAFRQEYVEEGQDPPFFRIADTMKLPADCDDFIAAVRAAKPAIVVIDTLNRTLSGSEISDDDMGAYYQSIERIQHELDCLVLVIHHTGWDTSRMRGHSLLVSNADASFAVRPGKKDATIAMWIEKQREGPFNFAIHSRLRQVEIGTDRHGDPITSCVVEPIDAPPAGKSPTVGDLPKKLSPDSKIALDATMKVAPCQLDQWNETLKAAFADRDPNRRRQAVFKSKKHLLEGGHVIERDGTVSVSALPASLKESRVTLTH